MSDTVPVIDRSLDVAHGDGEGTGKLFAIGLSRTGTSSLHFAAVLLGFSSLHYPAASARRWMRGDFSPSTTAGFAVISDIPTGVYYRQLDETHPSARYIFTVRDPDRWLDSLEAHFARTPEPSSETVDRDMIRLATYGLTQFNRQRMLDVFNRHTQDVMSYFANRPDDLLVLDIDRNPSPWSSLCTFLGTPIPDLPYPFIRIPVRGQMNAVPEADVSVRRREIEESYSARPGAD